MELAKARGVKRGPRIGGHVLADALVAQGISHAFAVPGESYLDVLDGLYAVRDRVQLVTCRFEAGAVHMAEACGKLTGRPAAAFVTRGPGACHAAIGVHVAMQDSTPLLLFVGQIPFEETDRESFQEVDYRRMFQPLAKWVTQIDDAARIPELVAHAVDVATSGRPGPVVVDIPKDVQFSRAPYLGPHAVAPLHPYAPRTQGDPARIHEAVELLAGAKRPILYTGGGVINAGPKASQLLRELQALTGAPVTSTLMGLGAFPASHPDWLGMVGMHGAYEANHAMHDCDVMVSVGARFDDRVTGRLDAFSPGSKKIHIDIDPSSINKTVRVDIGLVGDAGSILADMIALWTAQPRRESKPALAGWWAQIAQWRARKGFRYRPSSTVIKPQYAIERLWALTRDKDVYVTTEVGQHQMWAAQFFHFDEPNRWMTSGGLGTMGYGLPAAVGVQMAHPGSLVIDIAGEASVQMTMQEMSTAVQYDLPIKIFILNNEWMGMVRQWQQLLHGERYSHSYSESLPDFVKLAEAYGGVGIRADTPDELDGKILEMINSPRPVLFDCRVEKSENCLPMIPSGKAHNEMILGQDDDDLGSVIDEAGRKLV